MILIDALYINGGGAKVLLDYLISELEKTQKEIHYLIDERITGEIQPVKSTNILQYSKSSILSRINFYRRHRYNFSSVLCFGNLPPEIKPKAKVYTYFHQPLFLDIPENFSIRNKFFYSLKIQILHLLKNNTDLWWVQSDLIKELFTKKFHKTNVKILPFFPPLSGECRSEKEKHSYLYVSNAPPHKNHKILIEAFCTFFDERRVGKLILTVSKNYPEIEKIIQKKIAQKYPIENIGFVQRAELADIYGRAEYLIYPSLAESFGLGLVEAIENGCMVIGADLPYTHAVCKPSLTFNPLSVDSIVTALSLSLQNNQKPSENKIKNNISEIISLLH